MTSLEELVRDLIQQNRQHSLKRVMAKVIEVYGINKAKVSLISTGTQIVLPNKSGERLEIGDNVHIHYWGNISSGYIAVRNS